MKEVQIDGKWYYAEEPTEDKRYDNDDAIVWNDGPDPMYVHAKIAATLLIDEIPIYVTSHKITFGCAALLSTEHEHEEQPKKKSRRCTKIELAEWLAKGNGMWRSNDDDYNDKWYTSLNMSEKSFFAEAEIDFKIRKWNGGPMEPTAENMGLKESFFQYHENGQMKYRKDIDERGRPCMSWYDDRGNMTHFKFQDCEMFSDYDENGKETHRRYANGDEYWYDSEGRTIRTNEDNTTNPEESPSIQANNSMN